MIYQKYFEPEEIYQSPDANVCDKLLHSQHFNAPTHKSSYAVFVAHSHVHLVNALHCTVKLCLLGFSSSQINVQLIVLLIIISKYYHRCGLGYKTEMTHAPIKGRQ